MSAIIVGIHGLANKPPEQVLAKYWKDSISEGLQKNCGVSGDFDMEMVYWADLLYKHPLHDDDSFHFDKLYNDEPYTEGPSKLPSYDEGFFDGLRATASSVVGASVDWAKQQFGMDSLADWVLDKALKDLAFYYDDQRQIATPSNAQGRALAREVLRGQLSKRLLRLIDRRIMLIAHSMGSIIAYDVLRDIGQTDSDFKIADFVTIGSPLGLPHVKAKIFAERSLYAGTASDCLRTPTVVADSWVNYADRRDPVAFDTHLKDDFEQNRHKVRVEDDLIANSYQSPAGKANYHKSYGYLRAPELSKRISAFLS